MNPPESGFESPVTQKKESSVTFTRAELYEKVWSAPMVKLAKEFGISDRGLAKTCARLDVPVPSRGYWVKLQAGKRVSKAPLPERKPKIPEVTIIRRSSGSNPRAQSSITREPALQRKIDAALASSEIPRTLSNPHPLIRAWIEEDRRARDRARESIYSPVHLSVTRTETDRRRLRILSGLFHEFERLGYSVSAERERSRTITIRSSSVLMNFVLYEPYKRVRIPLTESL